MKHLPTAALPSDLFGRKISRRLTRACTELDHDIGERLRVARLQAVSRRKMELVPVQAIAMAGGGVLQHGTGWWTRFAAALPLMALVGGMLTIYVVENDNRANEVAEIDAALLTDDLPTAAYTDPGFLQFLKVGGASAKD